MANVERIESAPEVAIEKRIAEAFKNGNVDPIRNVSGIRGAISGRAEQMSAAIAHVSPADLSVIDATFLAARGELKDTLERYRNGVFRDSPTTHIPAHLWLATFATIAEKSDAGINYIVENGVPDTDITNEVFDQNIVTPNDYDNAVADAVEVAKKMGLFSGEVADVDMEAVRSILPPQQLAATATR